MIFKIPNNILLKKVFVVFIYDANILLSATNNTTVQYNLTGFSHWNISAMLRCLLQKSAPIRSNRNLILHLYIRIYFLGPGISLNWCFFFKIYLIWQTCSISKKKNPKNGGGGVYIGWFSWAGPCSFFYDIYALVYYKINKKALGHIL